jgi:hypothetical protein
MIRLFQMFVDVCERCGAASSARAFFEGVHDEAGAGIQGNASKCAPNAPSL